MNHYGALAQRHWQENLPTRYSQIPDPDSFFSTLGEEVATEIEELTRTLAGPDQPGEGYQAKLGRLNATAQMAREKVLPERVLLPAEPATEQTEDDLTDEPAEPNQPPASDQDWIPLREDPTHPYWQQVREEAELEELENADDDPPPPTR